MAESRVEEGASRLIRRLRWVVPISLSVMGLGYVLGETFISHEHTQPHNQVNLVIGVVLLSFVGPIITYAGLNWAYQNSERMRKAEQEQRQRNQQLDAMAELSRVVNQTLRADKIIEDALESLTRLLHVESGAIWLIDDGRPTLRSSTGVSDLFIAQEEKLPPGDCLCSRSIVDGVPLTLAEIQRDRASSTALCQCEAFGAAISAPIQTSSAVIGVLELGTAEPRDFQDSDLELLTTIGYQIGTALEKAALHQDLQNANLELEQRVEKRTEALLEAQFELEDRARALQELLKRIVDIEEQTRAQIASDLHDGIQQLVVGAMFETEAVSEALESHPEQARVELSRLQAVLQKIQQEMRNAIYNLRPVTLDSHGLVSALRECIQAYRRSSQADCQLSISGTPSRFDPEAELVAFRIVQESLNNVEAHSGASETKVDVRFEDGQLQLQVSDNGRGFNTGDYTDGTSARLGLLGMRERVEKVDGEIAIYSGEGEGTVVSLKLPLNRNR